MNGKKRERTEASRLPPPPAPANETTTRGAAIPPLGNFTPAERREAVKRWRATADSWRVGDLIRIRDFGGLVCRVVEIDAEILARGGRGLGVEDPRPDVPDLRWYQTRDVEFIEPGPDSPPASPPGDNPATSTPPPDPGVEAEPELNGGLDALLRRFYAGLAELELLAMNDRLRRIEIDVEAGSLRIRSERAPRVRRVVEAHTEEASK